MPCYSPIRAWRSTSTREVSFKQINDALSIRLPCGRCIGCRLENARQWAQRLTDENRFHDESSFITLTYAPENLPPGGTLVKKHFQDFLKRLRRRLDPKRLRFFHAGEYGEKNHRPHYHAIIFGHGFYENRFDFETSDRGDVTWSAPVLDQAWGLGMARIGAVTFESCCYVARYVTKKVTGSKAKDHYWKYDQETGECFDLQPEYATMSRRPGIARLHVEKYLKEIYIRDSVVSRGHEAKPPRFYDNVLAELDLRKYEEIKESRESALSGSRGRTFSKLEIAEEVKRAQLGTSLIRRYEYG